MVELEKYNCELHGNDYILNVELDGKHFTGTCGKCLSEMLKVERLYVGEGSIIFYGGKRGKIIIRKQKG